MGLDVTLRLAGHKNAAGTRDAIFIRKNGQTAEITRDEWDKMYPGREPFTVLIDNADSDKVFSANITHNLGRMALEAGIYECLWRPEEIGITHAKQLIGPLQNGVLLLQGDPDRFKAFNPENGWGSYDMFVPWVLEYLQACIDYPDATVEAWR